MNYYAYIYACKQIDKVRGDVCLTILILCSIQSHTRTETHVFARCPR